LYKAEQDDTGEDMDYKSHGLYYVQRFEVRRQLFFSLMLVEL